MTTDEQLWFAIGISGAVIFFESAILQIAKSFYKVVWRKPWNGEWNNMTRVVGGFVIFAYALYRIFTLPRA